MTDTSNSDAAGIREAKIREYITYNNPSEDPRDTNLSQDGARFLLYRLDARIAELERSLNAARRALDDEQSARQEVMAERDALKEKLAERDRKASEAYINGPLPDCMMPDGGKACKAFRLLHIAFAGAENEGFIRGRKARDAAEAEALAVGKRERGR